MTRFVVGVAVVVLLGLAGAGCHVAPRSEPAKVESPSPAAAESTALQSFRSQSQPAAQCAACHPDQYRDWTTSFHAHSLGTEGFRKGFGKFMASMKEQGRGGRDAALACLGCHAPLLKQADDRVVDEVAALVLAGDTQRIDDLQVGCVACHGRDGGFQGSIKDPLPNPAHASAYAPVYQRAEACAGCHDWVKPAVPCSTVYNDWQHTRAAKEGRPCQSCHMPAQTVASATGPGRTVHAHTFPGGRSAELLQRSVDLKVRAAFVQDELVATVVLKNRAAHRVPDG